MLIESEAAENVNKHKPCQFHQSTADIFRCEVHNVEPHMCESVDSMDAVCVVWVLSAESKAYKKCRNSIQPQSIYGIDQPK